MLDKINSEIAKTENEIRQLKNKEKQLIQEHSQLARRVRTRRLIERGAILESLLLEAEKLTNEQIKSILIAAFHTTAAANVLQKAREDAATQSSLV